MCPHSIIAVRLWQGTWDDRRRNIIGIEVGMSSVLGLA